MNRFQLVLAAILALALGAVGIAQANIGARENKRARVTCKIVKIRGKTLVSCPKAGLRGHRGPQGPTGAAGAAGPAGPAGATGGAGSGLSLNFNAKLKPGREKAVPVGNFTLREVAEPSGACNGIKLVLGSRESLVALGPGGAFSGPITGNEAVLLVNTETSNMFTAVTTDGRSTIAGIVGQVSQGGFCIVSGYVTGT